MSASMSATSIRIPTRVGFSGSTKVRMFVTPSGPKNSSRFGDASQWSVSLTSWYPNTVGITVPLGRGLTPMTRLSHESRASGRTLAPGSPQLGIASGRGGLHVHYALHIDDSDFDRAVEVAVVDVQCVMDVESAASVCDAELRPPEADPRLRSSHEPNPTPILPTVDNR